MPSKSDYDEIYDYSKSLDENREDLEGVPYFLAFKFMAGVGADPQEREGQDRALWQIIEQEGELSDKQEDWARKIVSDYPISDDLKERKEWQEHLATLFQVNVRFDKYDYKFAMDLIQKVRNGELLSDRQQKHLEMFAYRYREQLREKTIYTEDIPQEVQDVLGDNTRETMKNTLEDCKPAYEELKNDEN